MNRKESLMQVTDFNYDHIEQAAALARTNYEEARTLLPILPEDIQFPGMAEFAENGLGVSAFEDGKLVGFLCCCSPFEKAFGSTKARGVFSPLHANGASAENRAAIYAHMYQAAAKKWADAGVSSHALCLYASDNTAINQFFHYGFGHRCAEAIRPMFELDTPSCPDIEFAELDIEERAFVYPLIVRLANHMSESPIFILRETIPEDKFKEEIRNTNERYFAAKSRGGIVAYLKTGDTGENFITLAPKMRNIYCAYCLPQFRGKGIYQNLINHTIRILSSEGYTLLGVEFESFNPTGNGFWPKYFTPYTTSVARRIDENILEIR